MHLGASYIAKLGARTANVTHRQAASSGRYPHLRAGAAHALGLNEIGLARLRFDRPMIFGDYRDNRDLGGFILIDRITNETVAFGLIDRKPWWRRQATADAAAASRLAGAG